MSQTIRTSMFASVLLAMAVASCKHEPCSGDKPAKAKKGPAGIEWIHSKPAGIEFTKSEVTVAQYRACVQAGKCTEPTRKHSDYELCNWGHAGRDDHPINCISWNNAKSFCAWAGGRLPTEDEWYAEASNKGKREYPWGNAKASCRYVVMTEGGDGCGRGSTWPMCSKPEGNSVSGLCDMSGNVIELTSSLDKGELTTAIVVRGGSWISDIPRQLQTSFRDGISSPFDGISVGFRCGRSMEKN